MPSFKKPFSLYSRKIVKKKVWYYRTYDEYGQRTTGKSTGQTSKASAEAYCMELYKQGKLIPNKEMTLKQYAENYHWWIWDKCDYVKTQLARSPKSKPAISHVYVYDCLSRLKNHILPHLGKCKLSKLSPHIIEKWMTDLKKDGLAAKTINNISSVLKIMINEACRMKILHSNPFDSVRPFIDDPKKRGILTINEIRELFNISNFKKYWKENKIFYSASLTAAITGLRQGEIRALRVQDYNSTYLHIRHSYGKTGLNPTTKTKTDRLVPIPQIITNLIEKIKPSEGYIFSFNNGKSPCSGNRLTDALYVALELMGVDRKSRNINFHSFRHFINTYLRAKNISDALLKRITGHKTQGMVENYTHFQIEDFKEIIKVQEQIIEE